MRGVYLKKGNVKVTVVPYYRVGDLFLTTNATNPSSFLGGTWQLFGPGKTLVCVDTSDNDFKTVKKTGGGKTHLHRLTIGQATWYGVPMEESEYGLYIKNQSGTRSTTTNGTFLNKKNRMRNANLTTQLTTLSHDGFAVETTGNTYNSTTLQPYITCYVWIRTA